MPDDLELGGEYEVPLDVSQAMSLLVNAARIDPHLRDAAVKVERYLYDLFESRNYWCNARSEDISLDLARMREALEALVFYAPDGGSIDYTVSDFAIAILHGKSVEEATDSGRDVADG